MPDVSVGRARGHACPVRPGDHVEVLRAFFITGGRLQS
jgi:hypothetical protein